MLVRISCHETLGSYPDLSYPRISATDRGRDSSPKLAEVLDVGLRAEPPGYVRIPASPRADDAATRPGFATRGRPSAPLRSSVSSTPSKPIPSTRRARRGLCDAAHQAIPEQLLPELSRARILAGSTASLHASEPELVWSEWSPRTEGLGVAAASKRGQAPVVVLSTTISRVTTSWAACCAERSCIHRLRRRRLALRAKMLGFNPDLWVPLAWHRQIHPG